MDVVWLKRDVRLHDHAPLQAACSSKNDVCLLYLYEPNQLSEPTVHGSHIALINEGLIDFDQQLCCGGTDKEEEPHSSELQEEKAGATALLSDQHHHTFRFLTVCYNNAVPVLEYIHANYTINRLLAHEETGHYSSYQRDRQVRKWCKNNKIPFEEFLQSGVTRRLHNRDDFSKKLQQFLTQPQCIVDVERLKPRIRKLETTTTTTTLDEENGNKSIIRFVNKPMLLNEIREIPTQHRMDRPSRQKGGEKAGMKTLESFLQGRGKNFSAGISSPLSAWTSCSRLSIFLSWGHLSLRYVHQATKRRSEALKKMPDTGTFRKSLSAFQSRLTWRSHFTQKLESDPLIEKKDLHPSYQELRRLPNDWNETYYQAWATGTTGFPFVDACMRCLLDTGWLNFRMRAMLVSFATYNLWLDWKRIAPHLARVFLDYEPGIHYPQLQMQAGTTGINAMRVYNVIKQGKDQDPDGIFVKRYVKELRRVPKKFIHEPWKMTMSIQDEHHVWIGNANDEEEARYDNKTAPSDAEYYPIKIVDEQETARIAKSKVNAIRKMESTKKIAQEVYEKHGSRSRRDDMPSSNGNSSKKRKAVPKNQPRIDSFLPKASIGSSGTSRQATTAKGKTSNNSRKKLKQPPGHQANSEQPATAAAAKAASAAEPKAGTTTGSPLAQVQAEEEKVASRSWTCLACTFKNDNPIGLACIMCGTERGAKVVG